MELEFDEIVINGGNNPKNGITAQNLDKAQKAFDETVNHITARIKTMEETKDFSHEYHYMHVLPKDLEKLKPFNCGSVIDKDNALKAIVKIKKSDISQVKAILNKNNKLSR